MTLIPMCYDGSQDCSVGVCLTASQSKTVSQSEIIQAFAKGIPV